MSLTLSCLGCHVSFTGGLDGLRDLRAHLLSCASWKQRQSTTTESDDESDDLEKVKSTATESDDDSSSD